jgi:thiol-disulfide isomerase/thioredoxin
MRVRWIVAAVGAVALAAVAVGFYMPWRQQNRPMPAASSGAGASCPADAKPANFDFTLKQYGGADVTLASYKGKVVLLDFWATWCGPGKVEIPIFNELQQQYGGKGFQAIGVSVDDTEDKLKPYVESMKMTYPVLLGLGHEGIQDAYGPILGIPVTVIISRDGKVCATHTGLTDREEFEREIKALL